MHTEPGPAKQERTGERSLPMSGPAVFQLLVENAPDIIARYDRNLRHIYVSPAVEAEIGVPPEAFIGKTHREFGMPEDLASTWEAALRRTLETGEPSDIAFEYPTPWGPRFYECRIAVEQGGDPGAHCLLAVGRNITEHKRVEAQLRESEERFRELTEHLDSVFWLWSLDERRLLYVSPAYEHIWGRSRESLSRAPYSYMDAIHPADREAVREALSRIQHDAVAGVEYRVLHTDGTTRWVCSRAFPVRDSAGRVYRVAGITEDITERKQAEAERERVLEILGHDLRNPLAAILLSTELAMALADAGGAAVREPLEDVVSAVAQMQTLVDDILTAAVLRGGGITLHMRECDASTLVDEALRRIRPVAAAKGIPVDGLIPADLRLHADPERIQQVFANLLSNAVRLTPHGGRIEVRAERRRDRLWFSVADTGPGVPDEEIPRLFERYWRSDRTSRGGTGLGLTIAKGIVEAHDGHIWATSRVGEGSCFVFSLPTASPQPPRGGHPAPPERY